MFLLRRTFKIREGRARDAAELITKIGKAYESLGQRNESRVYLSGSTVPGPADTVYMDWTEETLMSAYRDGNATPDSLRKLFDELKDLQVGTSIEFFEMYSGD